MSAGLTKAQRLEECLLACGVQWLDCFGRLGCVQGRLTGVYFG